MSRITHKLKLRPLHHILLQNSIYHDRNSSLSYLKWELKKYITRLKQGKRTEEQRSKELKLENEHQKQNQQLVETWPQLVNQNLKDKIIKMFREQTSSDTLSTFTCSSCREATLCSFQHEMLATEFNLDVLKVPPSLTTTTLALALPYNNNPLQNILLDLTGVTTTEASELLLLLCKTCYSSLR